MKSIVFAVFALAVAASAAAQLPTATILGTVRDSGGAVVPGATITVTNTDTGFSRTGVTGGDGTYRLPALPVGRYEVRVELQGFRTAVRSGLTMTVGQEALLNFTLDLGTISETVSVTGEAPLVNTTSASLGALVDAQAVADLPLNVVVTGHRAGPRTLRWVYLQVLRELAHHCGHADILREQVLAD